MDTDNKEAQATEPTIEAPKKLRVSVDQQTKKAKEFASASSASLHDNIKRGLNKAKVIGLIGLEKASTYMATRKTKKENQ